MHPFVADEDADPGESDLEDGRNRTGCEVPEERQDRLLLAGRTLPSRGVPADPLGERDPFDKGEKALLPVPRARRSVGPRERRPVVDAGLTVRGDACDLAPVEDRSADPGGERLHLRIPEGGGIPPDHRPRARRLGPHDEVGPLRRLPRERFEPLPENGPALPIQFVPDVDRRLDDADPEARTLRGPIGPREEVERRRGKPDGDCRREKGGSPCASARLDRRVREGCRREDEEGHAERTEDSREAEPGRPRPERVREEVGGKGEIAQGAGPLTDRVEEAEADRPRKAAALLESKGPPPFEESPGEDREDRERVERDRERGVRQEREEEVGGDGETRRREEEPEDRRLATRPDAPQTPHRKEHRDGEEGREPEGKPAEPRRGSTGHGPGAEDEDTTAIRFPHGTLGRGRVRARGCRNKSLVCRNLYGVMAILHGDIALA